MHDSVDPSSEQGEPPWRNRNELRIYRSKAAFPAVVRPRRIVASRCASVHLLLHDLYYGNSARTTSQLTFDNNAAASEKAACRGGGAATAGVATRPGEALSLSLYLRWSTQVNQELYLPPPLMPYREMCGLLRASRRSVKPVDSL